MEYHHQRMKKYENQSLKRRERFSLFYQNVISLNYCASKLKKALISQNVLGICFVTKHNRHLLQNIIGIRYKTQQAFVRPAIRLSQNKRKWVRNVKNEKCVAEYFASLFSHFALLFSFFAFCSILHQGQHSHENSKDFVVYFFAALIKTEICLKCEKCIVSGSHFEVCFVKTFAKYPQNVKYEKCIAGLTKHNRHLFCFKTQ